MLTNSIATFLHCYIATLLLYNIATLRYCFFKYGYFTILLHYIIATIQYCYIFMILLHLYVVTLRYCFIMILIYCGIATLQYCYILKEPLCTRSTHVPMSPPGMVCCENTWGVPGDAISDSELFIGNYTFER